MYAGWGRSILNGFLGYMREWSRGLSNTLWVVDKHIVCTMASTSLHASDNGQAALSEAESVLSVYRLIDHVAIAVGSLDGENIAARTRTRRRNSLGRDSG